MFTFRIEECNISHWKTILDLRNDNKENFISQNTITMFEHKEFMSNNGIRYLVATIPDLLGDKVIGFAGALEDGDIRVCVDKQYRGYGVGKRLVQELIGRFPNLTAKIKIENEASIKLFESCGFKRKFLLLGRE